MVCKSCDDDASGGLGNDFEFTNVVADVSVKAGDTWHIYVDVWNNSFFFSDEGRVCVFEGEEVIATSGKFTLKAAKTRRLMFTGIMPNRPLYLNVSAVKEAALGFSRCEAGHAVFIDEGEDIPSDPSDPAPDSEESFAQWAQKNIVLILLLILAIIVIIKLG